jgi:hypothetical protein
MSAPTVIMGVLMLCLEALLKKIRRDTVLATVRITMENQVAR